MRNVAKTKEVEVKDKTDKKTGKPLLQKIEERSINFEPSLDECKEFILSVLDKMLKSTQNIAILETNELVIFLDSDRPSSFNIADDHKWIVSARERINLMLEQSEKDLLLLLEKFQEEHSSLHEIIHVI